MAAEIRRKQPSHQSALAHLKAPYNYNYAHIYRYKETPHFYDFEESLQPISVGVIGSVQLVQNSVV
jgi:hypothetical protein